MDDVRFQTSETLKTSRRRCSAAEACATQVSGPVGSSWQPREVEAYWAGWGWGLGLGGGLRPCVSVKSIHVLFQ